jgi:hypothetical protein
MYFSAKHERITNVYICIKNEREISHIVCENEPEDMLHNTGQNLGVMVV